VPLLASISTCIPRRAFFRYEPSWALHARFRSSIQHAWTSITRNDPTTQLVARLRSCRTSCKKWSRSCPPHAQRENDCRLLINLLVCWRSLARSRALRTVFAPSLWMLCTSPLRNAPSTRECVPKSSLPWRGMKTRSFFMPPLPAAFAVTPSPVWLLITFPAPPTRIKPTFLSFSSPGS
jgi:hypothetical protein